jgi:protein-S-isoprenylcysteine O-methyltransferase Ste14
MKEKIIHPPTVFVLSILSEVFLHFFFPLAKIIPLEFKNLGVILIILSALLAFWQFFTMKGKTPIPYGSNPKTLITNGPFKYTRNAFYVCLLLMSVGVAIILREFTPFIIVVIEFFVFDKYLIPPEEKVLEKNFGQRYKDYRQKVRRWI